MKFNFEVGVVILE